jgi:hypothetical protein
MNHERRAVKVRTRDGAPFSKKEIREGLDYLLQVGYVSFDPVTRRYTLTELAHRSKRELPASEHNDFWFGRLRQRPHRHVEWRR